MNTGELDVVAGCAAEPGAPTVEQLLDKIGNLEAALRSRGRIGMATGIVMREKLVGPEEAFEALRQTSMKRNRKLHDLCEDVILVGGIREVTVG